MNEQERAYNLEEFAAGASLTNPGASMPAKVGTAAPEFEATTVDGKLVLLSEFYSKQHLGVKRRLPKGIFMKPTGYLKAQAH